MKSKEADILRRTLRGVHCLVRIFVFIDHSWTHMYILGDSEGESNPNKYVLDGAVGESNPSKVCSCCGLTMWGVFEF